MRIGQTGEVVEILCGEVGRTAPARGCGSMWASTPTRLIRSDTFRISYVKYSTGAHVTIRTAYRALRKPDLTVARRAFLDHRCNEKTHNETKCFFARKRYFASCASFLHTFFWQDRKKYARGATVAVAQKTRHCGAIAEVSRASGTACALRTQKGVTPPG